MEKFCLQAGLERRKNIPKSTRTMMAVVIQKPAKSSRECVNDHTSICLNIQ